MHIYNLCDFCTFFFTVICVREEPDFCHFSVFHYSIKILFFLVIHTHNKKKIIITIFALYSIPNVVQIRPSFTILSGFFIAGTCWDLQRFQQSYSFLASSFYLKALDGLFRKDRLRRPVEFCLRCEAIRRLMKNMIASKTTLKKRKRKLVPVCGFCTYMNFKATQWFYFEIIF